MIFEEYVIGTSWSHEEATVILAIPDGIPEFEFNIIRDELRESVELNGIFKAEAGSCKQIIVVAHKGELLTIARYENIKLLEDEH